MGKDHHQHKHPHGHDAGVLSVYRATFPSKADVIAETSDPATSAMLEHLAALGCDTCFDRFDAQKPHCAFGLAGSCCRMCNMGPCRITTKSPVGVCGADADVIVARNLLRWVAAGVAAHALVDALKQGTLRGIVNLVGCNNPMSLAFSLWCHRMVIEYFRAANGDQDSDQDGFPPRGTRVAEQGEWLARLERANAVGSSGLAAAMAHYVGGAPLPIRAALRARERFELTGHLRWASNLFPDEFVLITAADAGPNGKVIVILPAGRTGLEVEKHPVLLDLQATASSSVKLTATLVEPAEILATDFDRFVRTVRPAFLMYQASFCWGLAARALSEANALIGKGMNEVFASELREHNSERDRVEEGILENLAAPVTTGAGREIVELRLSAARLAGAASRLESKLAGGAGYTSCSATARRFREAAFLPIQSPTEGQLLWELSRHGRGELSR